METRENRAVSTLLRVVPDELNPQRDGELVRMTHGDDGFSFHPIWIGEGLPADARRARDQIAHLSTAPRAIPIVTARRVSPGAQEILDEEQLSWADATGRAHLSVPGRLYLTRLDPIRSEARRGFQWSAAAAAIAETLLTWRALRGSGSDPSIGRVHEVAEAAGVSTAHTARILRQFDEQRYTAKTGAERGSSATREFRDPGRLLSDWTGQYLSGPGPGTPVEFHVPWRDPELSLRAIDEGLGGMSWAITSAAAADLIAPYLTSVAETEIYVSADDLRIARRRMSQVPDVTEVESGGRMRLFSGEPHVLRLAREVRPVDGVHIAPPARVYADLLRLGGRSAEAAEHLREVVLGF